MVIRSAVVMLLALLLLDVGAAMAGTAEQDLASLNAKREANGIPAGIALNPDWSAKCGQHVVYMRKTQTVEHAENPSSPWYTEGGNWAAGHAVLAAGIAWTANAFLWETAPLHLAQLLAPQLSEMGIADDDEFVCATTWPGYLRTLPPTTTVVTYPGLGTSIYSSEASAEWPTTPAQALGLANPTGPHLYVYQWGPPTLSGVTAAGAPIAIESATLTGPSGPVRVHWVDPTNPIVGPYLTAASGIIIPDHPLATNAVYTASVAFTNGVRYAWSFDTAISDKVATLKNIRIVPRRVKRLRVCIRRSAGHCLHWHVAYDNTITVTGAFTTAQRPNVAIQGADVGITFLKAEQAQLATTAQGAFRATYRFTSRTRRFRMRVKITAGADTATYLVRFRIVNRPGSLIAVVYGVGPAPMSASAAPPKRIDAVARHR